MADLHKPGTDNLPKGKYKEVGNRGGEVRNPRVVDIDQGDRLLRKVAANGRRFSAV